MLKAIAVRRATDASSSSEPLLGRAILQHDERHLRRRMIETDDGRKVLVDLPETVVLAAGDALAIEGGGTIEIAAAEEPLYAIRGRDPLHLTELAWHIGNRHCPCEMAEDHLVIRADPVLEDMLLKLGAKVEKGFAPFRPEGGAYGHGRTFGHGH